MTPQQQAVAALHRQPTVKVEVAGAALGCSRRTAYAAVWDDELGRSWLGRTGVPVLKITRRCWRVPSAYVLHVLRLEDLAPRLSQDGETTGDGPGLAPEPVPGLRLTTDNLVGRHPTTTDTQSAASSERSTNGGVNLPGPT